MPERLTALTAWTRSRSAEVGRAARLAASAPGRERDLFTQAMKGALAAVVAWLIAYEWLGAPLSFLAPWVAVVMVHATVYRSVIKGVQQVLAVVAGLLVATGGYLLAGDRTLALAIVLVVMMPLANWRELGDQGVYGPLTAVFVITTGEPSGGDLVPRLLETGLGTVVGVVVNAVVLPPVHLRAAREAIGGLAEEIAGLLEEVVDGLRGEWGQDDARRWLSRADHTRYRADEAWSAIRWGEESLRLNPRPRSGPDGLYHVLLTLEIVAKQAQGICRTLVDAVDDGGPSSDPRFVAFYSDVLDHAAAVVRAYRHERLGEAGGDLAAAVEAAGERARELHQRTRTAEFRRDGWLIHGSLLIEVDRLLAGLGDRA